MEFTMNYNAIGTPVGVSANIDEPFVLAKDIASRLSITPETVFEWSRRDSKPCPSYRVAPRVIRFRWSEVSQWISAGGTLRPKAGL
jgi:predicted DNA-binding transcriptional regulator AlpA